MDTKGHPQQKGHHPASGSVDGGRWTGRRLGRHVDATLTWLIALGLTVLPVLSAVAPPAAPAHAVIDGSLKVSLSATSSPILATDTASVPYYPVARGQSDRPLGALALEAVATSVTVTSLKVQDINGAVSTVTGEATLKVYKDTNHNGLVDGSDSLLGAAGFSVVSSMTVATPTFTTTVQPGAANKVSLLLAMDITSGYSGGANIALEVTDDTYITVDANSVIDGSNVFPINMKEVRVQNPQILLHNVAGDCDPNTALEPALGKPCVLAKDTANLGEEPQAGDTVVIRFDTATNAFNVNTLGLDDPTGLPVTSHTWDTATTGAWSTRYFSNDTLTITYDSGAAHKPHIGEAVSDALAGCNNTTGIMDPAGLNRAGFEPGPPTSKTCADVKIEGTHGKDTVSLTGASIAPISATVSASGVGLLALTLTANFNTVSLNDIVLTRLGTNTETMGAGSLSIYSDVNANGAFDGGDTSITSSTFGAAPTATLNFDIPLDVTAGTPVKILVVGTMPSTLGTSYGVQVASTGSVVLVAATYPNGQVANTVACGGCPISSVLVNFPDAAPELTDAVGFDASLGGAGVQQGDKVQLTFDSRTNGLSTATLAANINSILALSNGHGWGNVGAANLAWSTSVFENDTLTITFPASPTAAVAIGDTITIGGSCGAVGVTGDASICDGTGTNRAISTATITGGNNSDTSPTTGKLSSDRMRAVGTDKAPTLTVPGATNLPMLAVTVTNGDTARNLNGLGIEHTGTGSSSHVSAIRIYNDTGATAAAVVGGDALLGSYTDAAFSVNCDCSVGFTFPSPLALAPGASVNLLVVYDIASAATFGQTHGAQLQAVGETNAFAEALAGTLNSTATMVSAVSKIAFTAQPGGGQESAVWDQQPVVAFQNASGQTITGISGSVTLYVTGATATATPTASATAAPTGTSTATPTPTPTAPPATATPGPVLSCTMNPVSSTSGPATFSGCSLTQPGTYTLTAGTLFANTIFNAVSDPFVISPAPAPGGGGGGGSTTPPTASTPDSTSTPAPTATGTPTASPVPTGTAVTVSGPTLTGNVSPEGTTLGVLGGSDQPGGVDIVFPPTTVGEPRTVDVSVTPGKPDGVVAPPGTALLGLVIDVTPREPLTLGQIVTIVINPTPEMIREVGGDLSKIVVGVITPSGVVLQPVAVVNGKLVVKVDHFTKFTLFTVNKPGPLAAEPPEGALAKDLGPLLKWINPPNTTWFEIQVVPFNGDGPAINLVIGDSAQVAAAMYQVAAPRFGTTNANYVMLPGMTYIWRVRTATVATTPKEEDWTAWTVRSLRTPGPTAATVTRVAPEMRGTVASLTPALTWANSDASVFYYEVQLSKDPEFGPNAFLYWELRHGGTTTPPNNYRVPDAFPLEPNTTYHWRVRPRVQGDGKPVDWSATFVFNTPG